MTNTAEQKPLIVGIVGAGTMGTGIAQIALSAGERVLLFDGHPEVATGAPARINAGLMRLVERGKITAEQKEEHLQRLTMAQDIGQLASADLVIEAIVEDDHAKRTLIHKLGQLLRDDAIAATNTSSLSVTALAASYRLPGRFLGIHFFNPAPVMELVEVVPALQTADEVVTRSVQMLIRWRKDPIVVKDTPGFLVNRIARPFYGEALRMAEEGIAQPEEIDAALRSCGHFRMGPFELMDLIGNDVNSAVTESVFRRTFFDRRYVPSMLQQRYVDAGYLGRKTGRGFYDYPLNRSAATAVDETRAGEIMRRIVVLLINEAAEALRLGLASRDDIERAMTKATNYPKGLLRWADELGVGTVLDTLVGLFELYGDDRYRPSPLLRTMAQNGERFFA